MAFPLLPVVMGGSALLNFLGGKSQAGQQSLLREQLMQLFSTQNLGNETNNMFDLFRSSPMYTGLRGRAMESSSRLGGQLQTSYARAGLGRSGMAATALPIARASHIGSFQNIDMELFIKALEQARASIGARAGALTGTSGPSAMALGAGGTLQSLMPILLQLLSKRDGGGEKFDISSLFAGG